jgi:Protein of unknown function (DUF2630)
MNDRSVLEEIQRLAGEERSLRDRAGNDGLNAEEQTRLEHLEVALDQCWDLLRQRRARREFGEDPAKAEVRDPDTVERYQQ